MGTSLRTSAPTSATSSPTDAALLERCCRGDEQAWRTLVERYGALILSIPRRYGVHGALADDVFSEVCFTMVRALRTIRSPDKLPHWIIRTATRATWSVARRARTTPLAMPPSRNGSPDPADAAAVLEQEQLVRAALAQVPGHCRRLLELLYFATPSRTYDEIARQMKTPRGSLGPTRRRCLEKMRLHLEPLLGAAVSRSEEVQPESMTHA